MGAKIVYLLGCHDMNRVLHFVQCFRTCKRIFYSRWDLLSILESGASALMTTDLANVILAYVVVVAAAVFAVLWFCFTVRI